MYLVLPVFKWTRHICNMSNQQALLLFAVLGRVTDDHLFGAFYICVLEIKT